MSKPGAANSLKTAENLPTDSKEAQICAPFSLNSPRVQPPCELQAPSRSTAPTNTARTPRKNKVVKERAQPTRWAKFVRSAGEFLRNPLRLRRSIISHFPT